MPYMNGYELAAALKRDPMTRHIPVVFLTRLRSSEGNYLDKAIFGNRLLYRSRTARTWLLS
jgi:CheY-like chemotaxis protein